MGGRRFGESLEQGPVMWYAHTPCEPNFAISATETCSEAGCTSQHDRPEQNN